MIVLNELYFDDPMCPYRAGSHAMNEQYKYGIVNVKLDDDVWKCDGR